MHDLDQDHPTLAGLLARQLEVTPQHAKSLSKRFTSYDEGHIAMADELAALVLQLAGDELDAVLLDYDWICKLMLREEIKFRRTGHYRLSTFEQALAEVYADDAFMDHYMNGLLISQIWWGNHTETCRFYRDTYLAAFDQPFDHLEIGPGHGLLLYQAARNPHSRQVEAWDVSSASIAQTQKALAEMGVEKPVSLRVQDLFAAEAAEGSYDSIVMSEVLEHLDHPDRALRVVSELLRPGGRLFVNVPVNSPAPDHIYLLRSPEEAIALVEDAGFRILETHFAPQTGLTLEAARELAATISIAIIATNET